MFYYEVRELGLNTADGAVVFGQIYGMAEQISVPLAMAGFTVYKSVPYGPLTEVSRHFVLYYFYLFVSGAALPLPPGLREQGGSGGGQEGAGTPEEGADKEDPGGRQTLRLTFFGRLFDKLKLTKTSSMKISWKCLNLVV